MQSFLEGRPIYRPSQSSGATLANDFEPFVSPAGSMPKVEAVYPATDSSALDAPQVELLDHDGCIDRIIVTCTCCKRIELQCQY